MPQIPIVKRPEVRQERFNLQGYKGPDKNLGVLDYSSGIRAGNQIAESVGRSIANIGNLANSVLNFYEKVKSAEEAYNAGEIDLNQKKIYNGLKQRMQDNPNDYEKFDEWRQEADKQLSETAQPYLQKMRPDRRRMAEQALAFRNEEIRANTTRIANQARATTVFNGFQRQIKELSEAGELEGAWITIQQAHDKGVFSKEQKETMERWSLELGETYSIRRMVDDGIADVAERLNEKDEKGVYKNFPNLRNESLRRDLIRYARQKNQEKMRVFETDQVYRMYQGNPYSIQELDGLYKSGKIDQKTYNDSRKVTETYLHERERREKFSESQAEKAKEKNKKDAKEKFLYNLRMNPDIPDDPAKRREFLNEQMREAVKISIDDTFLSRVKSLAGEREKENQSYKQGYRYLSAMEKLKKHKDDFVSYANERNWVGYLPRAGTEVARANYEQARWKLNAFIKNNPNASDSDVDHYIDDMKKLCNANYAADMVHAWATLDIPKIKETGNLVSDMDRKTKAGGTEVRRKAPNGKIAVFDFNTKRFLRYE